MSNTPPEFHEQEEVEYGLQLPNGTEVWPPQDFHGTDLATPTGRYAIVEALRAAAVNLGTAPEDLLAQYQWLKRRRVHYLTVVWHDPTPVPFTDGSVISAPQPETPVGTDTEDVVSDWAAENTYSSGDGTGEISSNGQQQEWVEVEEPGGRHSV